MKKAKYIVALLFASLLFSVSCVQDNGNYDYTELPEMEIADYTITANGEAVDLLADNTIFVGKNNRVVITPNYKFDKEINPKYKWTLINAVQPSYPTPPIQGVVIGSEATLDYTFEQTPGRYFLSLEITNDKDEMDFKKIVIFNLTIESINGIALLYENGAGKGDIKVFKTHEVDQYIPEGDITEKLSVYSKANNGELINFPQFVDADYDPNVKYNVGTNEGLTLANVEMIVTTKDNASMFDNRNPIQSPYTPQFMESYPNRFFSFLIVDNKLYARTSPKGLMMCKNIFFKFNDNDYFPYVLMNDNTEGHIAFNLTKKSFEYLRQGAGMTGATGNWDYNPMFPLTIAPEGSVDISKTEMDALAYGRSVDKLSTVMKDDASQVYSVVFKYPSKDNTEKVLRGECVSKINITALPGINPDKNIWEFGRRGEYVYYSNDNELYVLNSTKGTSFNANLELASDETICKMSLLYYYSYEYSKSGAITDEYKNKMNGSVLYVATYKGGNEGKVYQYTINVKTGRPDVTSKKEISVEGKVKDIKLFRQV